MTAAIRCAELVKEYHTHKKVRALDHVNLEVQGGEVFGLLGPNGAGKTTLVRILATLLSATSGRAEVGGYDVRREEQAVRRILGYAGQDSERSAYFRLTVRENLLYFAHALRGVPMLAVGLWFTRTTVTVGGLLLGLLATALSIAALAQMGACFAALVLRHQQITAVFGLFNFAFQMLTGMFIPIQVLPRALRYVGIVFLPMSFGMDLLRHYVMGTRTVLPVPYEWAVLGAQVVVYAIVARFVVGWLERIARDQGLHYL
jgi:ABC-type Fe3+/spermidine/putrescine transport system ATPase subunit